MSNPCWRLRCRKQYLALAQYRRTRTNTDAHETTMKRLDAVTPHNSVFSR